MVDRVAGSAELRNKRSINLKARIPCIVWRAFLGYKSDVIVIIMWMMKERRKKEGKKDPSSPPPIQTLSYPKRERESHFFFSSWPILNRCSATLKKVRSSSTTHSFTRSVIMMMSIESQLDPWPRFFFSYNIKRKTWILYSLIRISKNWQWESLPSFLLPTRHNHYHE